MAKGRAAVFGRFRIGKLGHYPALRGLVVGDETRGGERDNVCPDEALTCGGDLES